MNYKGISLGRIKTFLMVFVGVTMLGSCGGPKQNEGESAEQQAQEPAWEVDRFADLGVMRYEVPEWEKLTPKQRVLCYYLAEATKCGRDILWDQNCRYNLPIRAILEGIYLGYPGDRECEEWKAFEVYLKRVWFSNGIHHHYAKDKFVPGFSMGYFRDILKATPVEHFPASIANEDLVNFAAPVIFDPVIAAKQVNRAQGGDILLNSAMNYYRGVTQAEATDFYQKLKAQEGNQRLSVGMNSQLVKENGQLVERVWRVGGMYSEAIERIVGWLDKAKSVAETPAQAKTIQLLIDYYRTGDLKTFNDYSIAWVEDTISSVDFVNGFIEDYGDPLGIKCSWEGLVNVRNEEGTKRTAVISDNALWFEQHSPIDDRFRKSEVKGVMAKVITAITMGGDCYPASPIGINLPNANWIRAEHGSKSVTIENLTYAYDRVSEGNGFLEEFACDEAEIARVRKYAGLADNVHTDLHECLGHGSGKLAPGITGNELMNYGATLEETRADLFALYYIMDPKLVELGIFPEEGEYAKSSYDGFIRNGLLTQLVRIEPGKTIEEDHMRNRALIAHWCYEHGKEDGVIEILEREGKHYVRINDYKTLRQLFGRLLKEVQRIKSEGDFNAGKALVEHYGVQVDPVLHREVLARFKNLNLPAYRGFVNPIITPVKEGDSVVDARLEYTNDYVNQMLNYSREYGYLPVKIVE